jgi:hypothetical protein
MFRKWGAIEQGVLVNVEESLSRDVLVRDWDQPFELIVLRPRLALLIRVIKKPPAGVERALRLQTRGCREPGTPGDYRHNTKEIEYRGSAKHPRSRWITK